MKVLWCTAVRPYAEGDSSLRGSRSIPFDLQVVIPVVPGNPPSNWREVSPTGLIPAIEDNSFRLADSTAIVCYLDRKHPKPALLPADNKELGAAMFLDAWAGSELFRRIVHPIFHNQVVNPNIRKIPPTKRLSIRR